MYHQLVLTDTGGVVLFFWWHFSTADTVLAVNVNCTSVIDLRCQCTKQKRHINTTTHQHNEHDQPWQLPDNNNNTITTVTVVFTISRDVFDRCNSHSHHLCYTRHHLQYASKTKTHQTLRQRNNQHNQPTQCTTWTHNSNRTMRTWTLQQSHVTSS